MLKNVSGVYRNGKIELAEVPHHLPDETRVIVTQIEDHSLDLRTHGIDETQAADLRARLRTFAEDWESQEMDIYDGVGAPTDHFELVTGQKPEPFESIARRYLENPALIAPMLANGGKLQAVAFVVRMLLARVPDLDRWEAERGHPMLKSPVRAIDNEDWVASAERQRLHLL